MSQQKQPPDQPDGLVGRSYTRARRHPWVIGKIQGWTLPLGPFTATQLGVLVIGLWLLVQTFSLWSRLGPFAVIVIATPFAATWAVRHATIEGRAPLRALSGYIALLMAPSAGWIRGHPVTEPRPTTLTGLITIAPPAAPSSGTTPSAAGTGPTNGTNGTSVSAARPPRENPAAAVRPRPTTLQALLSDLDPPSGKE